MKYRPSYFDGIKARAGQRWDQLERDPELAGPWHQLFQQVQSPRHVLSELLQNADDAGAQAASVRFEDGAFVFEHNGKDFTDENFASLCRFGYSNKRALHTIGFRGIGFKSTFSLGDRVELHTPTLSVAFDRRRFTEPIWLNNAVDTNGRTQIRVVFRDALWRQEVEKNLQEWQESPVSLLFFKNIRGLNILTETLIWVNRGPGPIPDSQRMALRGNEDQEYILIRSQLEDFPEEALAEIRQERLLSDAEDTEFPPSRVEIVVGATGRLYVVLPTGVETSLPFACNAPFIQDPARLKIKDPEISPTNRWLLSRVGALAAQSLNKWLANTSETEASRARAYGLMPPNAILGGSIKDECERLVNDEFVGHVNLGRLLLIEGGSLVRARGALIYPPIVGQVWPGDTVRRFLDDQARPPLSPEVGGADQQKLVRRGYIEEIQRPVLLHALRDNRLPIPNTWQRLLLLWTYVAPEVTGYRRRPGLEAARLNLVPVQGLDHLVSAVEAVRLGEDRLLRSSEDWAFLSRYLWAVRQDWLKFLDSQRVQALRDGKRADQELAEAAKALLVAMGLTDVSNVGTVLNRAASRFFSQDETPLRDAVRLTHIAARLGAALRDDFVFYTQDGVKRPVESAILYDADGLLEELLPPKRRASMLLHSAYGQFGTTCTRDEWNAWVSAGSAKLLTGILPKTEDRSLYDRKKLEQWLRSRGYSGTTSYPYKRDVFQIKDRDFPQEYWSHWEQLAAKDDDIWSKVLGGLLTLPTQMLPEVLAVTVHQVATTGNSQPVIQGTLVPLWATRLREKPCLQDVRGFLHRPGDLLRRTPDTEALLDVEPFVKASLDREANRPLFDVLGVRSVPTGPGVLLDRLRALATLAEPPTHEVEKWYRRLDQMIDACSSDEIRVIRKAFSEEKVILTHTGAWSTSAGVFLSLSPEDLPDAETIREEVKDLALWHKVGVADQPTPELIVAWLKTLPSGERLAADDLRRVRNVIARHPHRVWSDCEHWINLAGEWTRTASLTYAMSMQTLTAWSHLHDWVKQKTADLQRLPADVVVTEPFSNLRLLAGNVEERLRNSPVRRGGQSREGAWLEPVGESLSRIVLDGESETKRIRELGYRLAQTASQFVYDLEVVPYLDGVPAGTARAADVLWIDRVLYVTRISTAKMAKRLPDEIGRAFGRPDIQTALSYCVFRSEAEVKAYFAENFVLGDQVADSDDGEESFDAELEFELDQGLERNDGALQPSTFSALLDDEPVNWLMTEQVSEPKGQIDNAEEDKLASPDPSTNRLPGIDEPQVDPPARVHQRSIYERFAQALGFRNSAEDQYTHADGSWFGRTYGGSFPWERRSPSGELIRCYWGKDHCLDRQALQIEADVWALLETEPDTYALILTRVDGSPMEVTGAELRKLKDASILRLYPATYKIQLQG